MKKTSKKLLSLFLAIVMVVTSCSVGFTAFAADGNKTDSNNNYWKYDTDAKTAFSSLESLADEYIPALLNVDAIKNLLESALGMEVTKDTGIPELVEGASPKLIGLLGGSAEKSAIIPGYSEGTSDYYYSYLDSVDNDAMSFYDLYKFCQDNKDKGGDLGKQCKKTFEELDTLLGMYDTARNAYDQQYNDANDFVDANVTDWLFNNVDDFDLSTITKEELGEIVFTPTGKKLSEIKTDKDIDPSATTENLAFALKYVKSMFPENTTQKFENVADFIYFTRCDFGLANFTTELYIGLINEGGGTVTAPDDKTKTVTLKNYKSVAKQYYSFEAFCDDYSFNPDDWTIIEGDTPEVIKQKEALKLHVERMYDAFLPLFVYSGILGVDSDGNGEFDFFGTYYRDACIGILKFSEAYASADKTADYVTGQKITKSQVKELIKVASDNNWASDFQMLLDYLNSDDNVLSEAATNYLKNALQREATKTAVADLCEQLNARTDEEKADPDTYKGISDARLNAKYDEIKSYKLNDGTPKLSDMSFINRINFMIPAQLLLKYTGNSALITPAISASVSPASAFVLFNEFKNFVQPNIKSAVKKFLKDTYGITSSVAYKYSRYRKDMKPFLVEAVNSLLNSKIDEIFAMELGGATIEDLVNSLLETNVKLDAALKDIWQNLHDKPVETLFSLIPVLVVAVDELVVPLVLHSDEDFTILQLYDIICKGESGLLHDMSQEVNDTKVGIGALNFDLNKIVPAILNYLIGRDEKALSYVTKYDGSVYDNDVIKFTNIYVADKALTGARLNGGLAKLLKQNKSFQGDNAWIADAIDEAVTEIATFSCEAVEDYLAVHKDDERINKEGDEVIQKGLNNIGVALPQVIDAIGKKFIKKYNIKSDWTYTYKGKIIDVKISDKTTNKGNASIQNIKQYAVDNNPQGVLESVVDILIGNWLNGLLDIVNDTTADENNKISKNLPLVQSLLESLGGFGSKSVITDVFNGLFQLKRSDDESFSLKKQPKTNFVGFSNTNGYFLISNIQYKTKSGAIKGLVPFISTLISPGKTKADYSISNVYKAGNKVSDNSPTLANARLKDKSAAGTDYDELLTKENLKAAKKLVKVLDTLLASLLENTSLNGFDLDKTDNILAGIASAASAYLGAGNTNDIVKLLNNYLYYIVGESKSLKSRDGRIGTRPTSNGNVDKKKIYTSANLSNLVIQTYSLIENIVDYLFYNKNSGLLSTRDPNMLIADALYGIISPDAVAVRMGSKYSATAKVLKKDDYKNWNSFKIQLEDANQTAGKYKKDYLKYGFKKGNKKAFYNALGESFKGVATILSALLTKTYIDSKHSGNYYSVLVYPVLSNIADATGAEGVMKPSAFNKATPVSQLVDGLLTPVSNILAQIYDAPASFLLNLVKGIAGIVNDKSIRTIIGSLLKPVKEFIYGAARFLDKKVSKLSPTLASYLRTLAKEKLNLNINLPKKDIIVTLINGIKISGVEIGSIIKLPSIDWDRLNKAKSPEEVLLLIYGYLVDTVLNSDILSGLVDSLAPGLTKILKKLSAAQILEILNDIIDCVQSPTEVFWTFSQYAGKITNTFVYPQQVLPQEASKAVGQLDDIVTNVFPLLNALGVTDIEGLNALVNDKLYTNDLLTKATTAIYGALSKGTVGEVFAFLDIDVTPQGFAKYLTNKKYGKTYTSAAKTLKKAKSWDKVKSLNWGFTDGSAKAQKGFVAGLAAMLRPLNDALSILLAEGRVDSLVDLDVVEIAKMFDTKGSTKLGDGENGAVLDYKLKDGIFELGIRSNNKTTGGKKVKRSVVKIDIEAIAKDLQAILDGSKGIALGTNGYESAVIPILEAFMCKKVKTYKQYKKDYKKAKDNLLIDILTPIAGLIDDVTLKPFDTITKILPNVAYFIDSNGLAQAVGNLLGPITGKNGLLGILKKDGFDIDKIIKLIFDKDLGTIVTDALDMKNVKFTLKLAEMEKTNIQVLVLPLVKTLLKKNDTLKNIVIPDFTLKKIASHGKIVVTKSKARNSKGKYTTRQVKSRQGETLVALLRYVSTVLIKNASVLKKIICNIDAIKKNDTLKGIIGAVFTQIGTAHQDDIVRAVFYFLTERATDSFFDYRNFKYDDTYKFSWGDMDEEFCRKLAPMLDGMIGSLLEGGLTGLVAEKLYTDDLVAKLATGLYGAVEGVNINDNIGSLTNLLAMTDIDFTTYNVASLLTNERYGTTYPGAAAVIRNAGSWKNVKAEDLKFGVKDRKTFLGALVAVLRPIYGVLDVILNDASLNIFDLVKIPGSDGYTSTIVPLLEAFGVYNIKTQYEYRADAYEAYDNILLDIINPLWDKVEDILNAPLETLMSILPNLSLFFANDGLLQIVDNLLTPVSALLKAVKPIVDVNEILSIVGLDLPKLLREKANINLPKFDIYDLPGTLRPVVGAKNVVNTLNGVISIIKIKDTPLGLVLPEIDWFQLASHGEFVLDGTSQAACYGKRIYVKADEDETLIALLRFLINTINYKDNYDKIVSLVTGLLGDNVDESLAGTISDVLSMLKGDADSVIADLVELLQQLAG